jgi:two-component system response regulator ResD
VQRQTTGASAISSDFDGEFEFRRVTESEAIVRRLTPDHQADSGQCRLADLEANMVAQPIAEAQQQSPRVLIVDDEPLVRELIAAHLAADGNVSDGVGSGEEALALLDRKPFDLVILDVGLPKMSGFDVCRQIRARSQVPVIFVTAAGNLAERLHGFDLGGDDYIVKPMDAAELHRRVRAVLRRHLKGEEEATEVSGPDGVTMNLRAHEVHVHGEELMLTPKEFSILRVLLERRGEVLTTDTISTHVWGYETFGQRNFVEAHVSRRRSKLNAGGSANIVTTVRGIGYVIR